ncbi:hypothetical protein [Bradyrhizobium sp. BR 1432]|uniref:hypothetical protein n=1 Tax=Bradyrhizobium sp. BR 1432 TaxID=3447966 RepID=UPI003EE45341
MRWSWHAVLMRVATIAWIITFVHLACHRKAARLARFVAKRAGLHAFPRVQVV